MNIFVNAIIMIFSGLAGTAAMVVLVYGISWIADRMQCMQSAVMTVEELEARRTASPVTIKAGLAGLLKEERDLIFQTFFERRVFPYRKTTESTTDQEDTDTIDVEAQIDLQKETEQIKSTPDQDEADVVRLEAQADCPRGKEQDEGTTDKDEVVVVDLEAQTDFPTEKEDIDGLTDQNQEDIVDLEAQTACEKDENKEEEEKQVCEPMISSKKETFNVEDGEGLASETLATLETVDEKDDDPTCSICLNVYDNNEKVIVGTSCSHMFHYDCFMQWVEKGNEDCPYCRMPMITPEEFHKTAIEVIGITRVEKLKTINEAAAARVAALAAAGQTSISHPIPPTLPAGPAAGVATTTTATATSEEGGLVTTNATPGSDDVPKTTDTLPATKVSDSSPSSDVKVLEPCLDSETPTVLDEQEQEQPQTENGTASSSSLTTSKLLEHESLPEGSTSETEV